MRLPDRDQPSSRRSKRRREWRAPELPPEFNLAVAAGINNKSLCNILALKDKDQVAGIGRAPTSISLIVETVLE